MGQDLYYSHPIQVRVKSPAGYVFGGIAFHEYLVDGRDGMIYTFKNLFEGMSDEEIDNMVIEMEWLDISDSILNV